jgi:hypothetical protein
MVIMQVIKSIYNFFGAMRIARAASTLAHNGDHKGAQKLMMTEFKGWI